MVTGLLAGILLGLAHWRMFLRNIQALQPRPDSSGKTRMLVGLGSGMRTALTATMGFILVVRLGVNPLGLGMGLLVSMYGFRVWAFQSARKGMNGNE